MPAPCAAPTPSRTRDRPPCSASRAATPTPTRHWRSPWRRSGGCPAGRRPMTATRRPSTGSGATRLPSARNAWSPMPGAQPSPGPRRRTRRPRSSTGSCWTCGNGRPKGSSPKPSRRSTGCVASTGSSTGTWSSLMSSGFARARPAGGAASAACCPHRHGRRSTAARGARSSGSPPVRVRIPNAWRAWPNPACRRCARTCFSRSALRRSSRQRAARAAPSPQGPRPPRAPHAARRAGIPV
jgi:hypothetical protein